MATLMVPQEDIEIVCDGTTVTDNGMQLYCKTCRMSNCHHIQRMIKNNLDLHIFDFKEVEVPLSMTHDAWIHVVLGEAEFAGAKPITIHGSHEFNKRGHDVMPERYVGLLSRLEGRRVARSMIVAWLRDWNNQEIVRCRSRAHGQAEENYWRDADATLKVANIWLVLTTGACFKCNQWMSESDIPVNPTSTRRLSGVPY